MALTRRARAGLSLSAAAPELAAGAPPRDVAPLVATWAVVFVTGALAVRAAMVRARPSVKRMKAIGMGLALVAVLAGAALIFA